MTKSFQFKSCRQHNKSNHRRNQPTSKYNSTWVSWTEKKKENCKNPRRKPTCGVSSNT